MTKARGFPPPIPTGAEDERPLGGMEVSRMTGIPSPHLTDMKKGAAAARRKNGEGL